MLIRLVVVDQAVGSLAQPGGKKSPRQDAGEHHERVGRVAVRRQFGDAAENDGEDQHREKGPNERPQHADDCLLIADGKVAPREHPEQFAIAPQVQPIVPLGSASFDNDHVLHEVYSCVAMCCLSLMCSTTVVSQGLPVQKALQFGITYLN